MKKLSHPFSSSTIPSEEIRVLRGLMEDFPCDCPWSPEEAIELINVRYLELEKSIENIPAIFKVFTSPAFFSVLVMAFHRVLFDGILSNKGKIRMIQDKYDGRIGFGGEDYRHAGNLRFSGSPASLITPHLELAFFNLQKKDSDPIGSAMRFYQHFVKIHPFYDANGRIARLIVSIYLYYHGYYVQWEEILKGRGQTKFYKKLNDCHKRFGGPDFEAYFNHLFSFFKSFVVSKEDLQG